MADDIESRVIRAQIELLRLDAGVRREVRRLLARLENDLVEALRGNDPTGIARTALQQQRAEALLAEVRIIIDQSYRALGSLVAQEMEGIAALSAGKAAAAVNVVIGAEIINPSITPGVVRKIAANPMVDGLRISEWLSAQSQRTTTRFLRALRLGMAAGETIDQLVKRVRGNDTMAGVVKVSRREAEALVRTTVIAVGNQARIEQYFSAPGTKSIRWLSTLDNRTTPICRALDGKEWDRELRPIGHKFEFPGPTAHWGCRSTQVPVMEKYSAILKNEKVAAIFDRWRASGDRAAMGGPVLRSITYEQWLRTQSEAVQREVLGPNRWRMWTESKLSFEDMVDQSGRPLTLNELRGLLTAA